MKIRNFALVILVLLSYSCATSVENYEGYIYEKENVPAEDVLICEKNRNNCTKTNKQGFFKLKKDKNTISDLVVVYKGKTIDTLKTAWEQQGEKLNFSFIKGKNDTLFIEK